MVSGAQADYARLFPDPAALAWQQGDEQVLWLDTNLQGAELRVSDLDNAVPLDAARPALGLGAIKVRDQEAAEPFTLGRGRGCQDTHQDDNGTDPNLVDPDDVAAATADDYDALWLVSGSGLGLVACGDSAASPGETTGTVSLYSGSRPDGVALATYTVRAVAPASTTLNSPPVFDEGPYALRQVCVDDGFARADYFTGGETVGATVSATDADSADTLTYGLGMDDPANHYIFFDVDSSTSQLSVNDIGANDHSGLVGDDALYPLLLTVTDGNGGSDRIQVTVQLDLSNVSTNGDGVCP